MATFKQNRTSVGQTVAYFQIDILIGSLIELVGHVAQFRD